MRIPTPAKGTCQWILGHPLFVSWLEGAENALLWLTGHPGCGKTTLSYFLAKQLETSPKSRARSSVCIYFCDDKISKQNVANNILIGLIFQLIQRHRSLARHVRKVYQMHGQNIVRSFTALWGLFKDIVTDPKSGPTIVIIDALDECEKDSRRSLLQAIKGFIQGLERPIAGGKYVKFVLTSRPLEDVERIIDRVSEHRIHIDDCQSGPDGDLQIYIRQRLGEISEQHQFNQEFRHSLQELLYSKSGQTFLWVHMILAALESVPEMSINKMKAFVQQIPSDLERTYMLLVSGIPEDHLEAASKLLKLILGSSRPLHLDEINIAFSVAANHRTAKEIKEDCQTSIRRTLNSILGQLVRISDSKVSLVHQSAKEFILQETESNDKLPGAIRTIRKEGCALEMATACINYLLLDNFAEDSFSLVESPTKSTSCTSNSFWEDEDEEGYAHDLFKEPSILDENTCRLLASEHHFYEYAALHWTEHFVLCEAAAPQRLRDAAKKLLDTSTAHCINWLRFHSTEAITGTQSISRSLEPVTLAALFDFHETLRDYLNGNVPLQQGHLDSALFWGAEQGHDRIVDTLLRAGADPNARVYGEQTALIAASKNGHSDCVRTLLADKRTDPNMRGERGRTALSFACYGGHDEVVQTLLGRKDCGFNEEDESGSTALIWAAGSGRTETVNLLAQHPMIDINHRDKSGRTVVSWAAGDGMDEVLKTLLRVKWADPNLKDNEGRSPLSWAAGNGCTAAVRVLLRNSKVEKTSVDKKLKSAITWACERGQADSLRTLLDHECPGVDQPDESGWTPLAWAIHNASPATVELLVSNPSVDIEKRDKVGRTPLSWAVSYGHLKAVKILLRAGADPRSESDTGLTPISAAENLGQIDTIEELRYYMSEESFVSTLK
jgi:ankyrin repeat protein/energy-coupling factor transporter ATP-binding protein EcfA2